MMRWVFLVLLSISIIATWFMMIYAFLRGWGPYIRSRRQKKARVNARIKERQGTHEFDPVSLQHHLIQKVLVFECDDGVERDYIVHDDIFDWVEAGDDGVLVYQGELFVDFEARRPRHDMEKMLKRLTRS